MKFKIPTILNTNVIRITSETQNNKVRYLGLPQKFGGITSLHAARGFTGLGYSLKSRMWVMWLSCMAYVCCGPSRPLVPSFWQLLGFKATSFLTKIWTHDLVPLGCPLGRAFGYMFKDFGFFSSRPLDCILGLSSYAFLTWAVGRLLIGPKVVAILKVGLLESLRKKDSLFPWENYLNLQARATVSASWHTHAWLSCCGRVRYVLLMYEF